MKSGRVVHSLTARAKSVSSAVAAVLALTPCESVVCARTLEPASASATRKAAESREARPAAGMTELLIYVILGSSAEKKQLRWPWNARYNSPLCSVWGLAGPARVLSP